MRIALSTITIIFFQTSLFSQTSPYGSETKHYELVSEAQQAYSLTVTLPKDFDPKKEYKSLYYLDGWWLAESVLGAYALLSITEQIDDVVLIGLSADGSLLDWNVQRTIDYTPSIYQMPLTQNSGTGENAIPLDSTTTGGAERFADFLATSVFEFVEEKHPDLSSSRGLLGHSFGGLFGFYLMQNRPELFAEYIMISPALWWNKSELLQENLFEQFALINQPNKLFLAYGEAESGWITRSAVKMDEIIQSLEKSSLKYSFVPYPASNHNSVLPRAIYDGLFYLYSKE